MSNCLNNPKVFPNLETISDPFEGILLDAYGVFWGGNAVGLFPNCKETMERLVDNGKILGILSNSTQQAEKEIEKIKKHGLVQGKHFHFYITSGTVAQQIFSIDNLPFSTLNKKYYCFGIPHPTFSSHHEIFKNTPFQETDDIEQADFIYISVPHIDGKDQIDPQLFKNNVETFKNSKLPMICVNPDRFAHEGNPPRAVVRQGSIASMHEDQGGVVFYVGKPSEIMYLAAMKSYKDFGVVAREKVLMVGDTPETDIRGAQAFGMPAALLIKTGIMADRILHQGFENVFQNLDKRDFPNFLIEHMGKQHGF